MCSPTRHCRHYRNGQAECVNHSASSGMVSNLTTTTMRAHGGFPTPTRPVCARPYSWPPACCNEESCWPPNAVLARRHHASASLFDRQVQVKAISPRVPRTTWTRHRPTTKTRRLLRITALLPEQRWRNSSRPVIDVHLIGNNIAVYWVGVSLHQPPRPPDRPTHEVEVVVARLPTREGCEFDDAATAR